MVAKLRVADVDFDAYHAEVVARGDVRSVSSPIYWAEDLLRELHGEETGCWLPWKHASGVRLRDSELSIWAGVNGHGKSLLLGQVMLALCKQQQKVVICSFEMPVKKTLKRLTRQATGTEFPTDDYAFRFLDWCQDKLWLYDQERTTRPETLLGVLAWCAQKHGITHFVIDSLMKCGFADDDYSGQKYFVDQLTNFAKVYKVHVHLVCHSRKRESEHSPMDKFDIKGSGVITDMADNVFTVWRNKRKEAKVARGEAVDEPDAVLICDKQRHGEWEGRIGLDFHAKSMQYIPRKSGKPLDILSSILAEMESLVA